MASLMRRLVPLFACLMLVLTLWTGTAAHAAEVFVSLSETSVLVGEHAPGDADEVQADADKGFPHHHNLCSGHEISVPIEFSYNSQGVVIAAHVRKIALKLTATKSGPALRPPNA